MMILCKILIIIAIPTISEIAGGESVNIFLNL